MTNALIHETSPYLLQHAHNPVDWLPWGDDAFLRAKKENKMVFLSIGYSTCHWCHVMARESFENEEVAEVMNRYFINVKVDREERPDVDATYMAFVQALTGSGGWPMSVWLTPDGKPVVGGTYFPPDNQEGQTGFSSLCQEVGELWNDDAFKLEKEGAHALKVLQERADELEAAELDLAVVKEVVLEEFRENYDCDYGGFGKAPKFPRPVWLELLGQLVWSEEEADHGPYCKKMFCTTLLNMQRGGIADHLAGGFHRYAVDSQWHVPHFEKMLYDQAQLLKLYTNAWLITKEDSFRQTAFGIRDYLLDDLLDPCGAFHAGEDADSLGEDGVKREGAYWTWSVNELQNVLEDPKLFAVAACLFDVKERGNAKRESDPHGELHGRNTLWKPKTDAQVCLACSIEMDEFFELKLEIENRMLTARGKRIRPHRDDKIVLAWNAYAIEALMLFSKVFDCDKSYKAGKEALWFLRENLVLENELARAWRANKSNNPAFAQDYAALIQALWRSYQTDGDRGWLDWATDLQRSMDKKYWDADRMGYSVGAKVADRDLIVMVEDFDGPEPSTNSVALTNLEQWQQLDFCSDRAEKLRLMQERTASAMMNNSQAVPAFIATSFLAQSGWCKITCTLEAAQAFAAMYLPNVIFEYQENQTGYIICKNGICMKPVLTVTEVLHIFEQAISTV